MNFKRILRSPIAWILLALIAIGLLIDFTQRVSGGYQEEATSRVVAIINGSDPLEEVILIDRDQEIRVTLKDESQTKYKAIWVGNQSDELIPRLNERVAAGTLDRWEGRNATPGFLSQLLGTLIPFIIIGVLFFFLLNSVQGGGSRVMQFGKSKAKITNKDTPKTTFSDVAGADEAVEELQEIKEFLAEPAKFQAVGAKIPKGVLLYGQPGTGKTLLARAVAGEAGVPFFSISGSDFVEMFVGVGASRVRDLFEQAKENAPAIVFIDEIDAVGRHRGAGMGGGHDEREQTLNQLLVEMDGFDVRGGCDPDRRDQPARRARPGAAPAGSFRPADRRRHARPRGPVPDPPGACGGQADVPPTWTWRAWPDVRRASTGADLANVLNEAALLTARQNARQITNGVPGRGDRPGRRRTAEAQPADERAGKADHGVPRGRTRPGRGGSARHRPGAEGDDPPARPGARLHDGAAGDRQVRQHAGRAAGSAGLHDGGRAAEELVFHDPTTGASNDIEKATGVARAMVTQYGMTERLGAVKLGSGDSEPFLGRDFGHQRDYSEDIAAIVDQEVSKLISDAHQEAFDILSTNRDVLDDLVRALFEKETLDRAAVAEVSSRSSCGRSGRPGPARTAGCPQPFRRSPRPRPRSTARTAIPTASCRPATVRRCPPVGAAPSGSASRPAPAARAQERAPPRSNFSDELNEARGPPPGPPPRPQ